MSNPLSIYIHVPFCLKKCDYCDFFSTTDRAWIDPYLKALAIEIQSSKFRSQTLKSVYLGGGTPSVLPASQIEFILNLIVSRFYLVKDTEITIEVNPGTIEQKDMEDYRRIGINRISIGVQSFDQAKLKFLTRIHSAAESLSAVKYSRSAGFENISIDLMYGLPAETRQQWLKDLNLALELKPAHLSCYMLTVEPNTPLFDQIENDKVPKPDPVFQSDMFKLVSETLTNAGFDHYEISNFSSGKHNRSIHNSNYWNQKPYLGFGPSAHSFAGEKRWWNYDNLEQYLSNTKKGLSTVQGSETLDYDQMLAETIMLGLRTSDGIQLERFEERFKIRFESYFKDIIKMIEHNRLGQLQQDRFVLKLEGKTHLNDIVERFAAKIFND